MNLKRIGFVYYRWSYIGEGLLQTGRGQFYDNRISVAAAAGANTEIMMAVNFRQHCSSRGIIVGSIEQLAVVGIYTSTVTEAADREVEKDNFFTQASFSPELFYPKNCVNCAKSEFAEKKKPAKN